MTAGRSWRFSGTWFSGLGGVSANPNEWSSTGAEPEYDRSPRHPRHVVAVALAERTVMDRSGSPQAPSSSGGTKGGRTRLVNPRRGRDRRAWNRGGRIAPNGSSSTPTRGAAESRARRQVRVPHVGRQFPVPFVRPEGRGAGHPELVEAGRHGGNAWAPPSAFYAPAGDWRKRTTGRIRSGIRRAAAAPAARSVDGRREGSTRVRAVSPVPWSAPEPPPARRARTNASNRWLVLGRI
jgi:hypothetical protein